MKDWREERSVRRGSIFDPPNRKGDSVLDYLKAYDEIRDQYSPPVIQANLRNMPGFEARRIQIAYWEAEEEAKTWLATNDPSDVQQVFAKAKAQQIMDQAKAQYDADRLELGVAMKFHREIGGENQPAFNYDLQRLDHDGLLTKLSGIDIQSLQTSIPYERAQYFQMKPYRLRMEKEERERNARRRAAKEAKADVSRSYQATSGAQASGSISSKLKAAQKQQSVPRKQYDPNGPKDLANAMALLDEFAAAQKNEAEAARAVHAKRYKGGSFTMGVGDEGMSR